jgi:signal transduction histidine kinase/CheY-like chemotaxis protein
MSMVIRFFAVYAVIFIIAFLTEHVREKVQARLTQRTDDLLDANQKLVAEIDERRRIEKALRDSEGFLDNVIESIQDGIIVLNTDLTIRHTNGIMRQRYQNLNLTIGDKCYQCFHGRDHPCDHCPVLQCIRSGKSEQRSIPSLSGNPEEWLEGLCFPIRDSETGEITGVVEMIRDMSKTKYLERQLARAQKMEAIGTLAGGVAHDLNNILSGIVSYPELLLMELPQDSPMRIPIETIQDSGKKAAAIVQDMLTLARRGVAIDEVVNLNEIASTFLNSLEFGNIQEYHPDVAVTSDLQPDLLNIVGSPVHLSKTIMNLVSNAAEAISGAGSVTVSTQNRYVDNVHEGYETISEGEYVVLTVSDSGSGISADDMHHIFEPFYTKKTMGRSGTGLGMAVVWGTVKDMQGFVDIQSSLGEGTTVCLYFPATRDKLAEKVKAAPMEKYLGSEKVLVVDDIEEQREIASAMLRKIGYSVTAVSSGEESIRYLARHRADVLVLDMMMDPGMDGLETYKEIIKHHPNQKAIIASGYAETGRVKAAQRLGAGPYIRKPYTLEKLGLSIRAELDKKREKSGIA